MISCVHQILYVCFVQVHQIVVFTVRHSEKVDARALYVHCLSRNPGLTSPIDARSPGALHLSTGLDSPSAGSTLPSFSPGRSATAHPGDQGAQGLSLTSPVLIAQSEHYLSPSRLRDIVAASDLANTADKKLMHVAYGRAPLVIGSIAVTSLTTYGECVKLVLPLVAEYVSTIAANESIHNELVSKYSLMDAKGEALTQEHLQVRRHTELSCSFPLLDDRLMRDADSVVHFLENYEHI